MKKTILAISAIAMITSNLFAVSDIPANAISSKLSSNWVMDGKKMSGAFPIRDVETLTKAHGGNLSPIAAYSDGMGVKVVSSTSMLGSAINNSAYNKLVFKYGEAAKASGLSLADQILNGTNKMVPSVQDIKQANKIKEDDIKSDFLEGKPCDDGNQNTRDTIYINGVCTGGIESIYIQNGKYSDGTEAKTCWEYMNGKTTSSKEYLKADKSLSKTSFYLSDGRIAQCDFQALQNIHNNNDWSLLFKPDFSAQCYNSNGTSTFIYAGKKGVFFPHPKKTGKCNGTIITNGMFKTLTFEEKIKSPKGDGVNFSIDGDNINPISFYLSPTDTNSQTISAGNQVNIATFNTDDRDNAYDWSILTITNYSE